MLAVNGRVFPSIWDLFLIFAVSPTVVLVPWLTLHYMFRSVTYVITTERVLVVEPRGITDQIRIDQITRCRGSRKSLLIYGRSNRVWLPRLPDAWHFEAVILKLRDRIIAQGSP